MSLINQMLQDLEARNAKERHQANGIFHGLISRAPEGVGSRRILLVLSLIIIILVGITIFLGWKQFNTGKVMLSNADDVASQTIKPGEINISKKPARTSDSKTSNSAGTVKEKAPPVAPRLKTTAEKPAPIKTKKENIAIKPGATKEIEKKSRPWTRQQQAVIAYQKAYALLKDGKRLESEPYLWEALRHNPRHSEARETLVAQLLAAGRLIEAEELLEKGLQFHPGHSNLTMLFARLRVEQGNLSAAVQVLEEGLNKVQMSADFFALLAALYQQQGRSTDSIARYRDALVIQPQQAAWWAGLGISLETEGLPAEATEAYSKALKGKLAIDLRRYIVARLEVIKD